ncbi:FkbM family methyltransferase [Methanocalculus taiwanensis]|uniref:FkbM family methyltransferase n=1 Tax=Methanocalculus taiwanensis TaxID=106207 RepID=A0ABD4TQF7_9EURY|nr:FkbM family methyltransferase [Methanocalculus taiwanensis]MCQ1539525.1 FkbM family methyltransferase [Methanocalculus taiwanensis]
MRLLYDVRMIYRHNYALDLLCGSCRYLSSSCSFEKGIITAHMQLTQSGDRVVIVGGGDGRTAIAAARRVGCEGSVFIFEGGDRSYTRIARLLDAKGLSSTCCVKHAVVGPLIDVYGGDCEGALQLSPTDLPDCDILELDCEGSEIEILRRLCIRPRVIIVEIHPFHFPEDPGWIMYRLTELGYRIIYRSGHNGIEIDHDDLEVLLSRSRIYGGIMLKNGATTPVVIAAVLDQKR